MSTTIAWNGLCSKLLVPNVNSQCLQNFVLAGNQIAEIPSEIGKLSSLTSLDLGKHMLRALKSNVGTFVFF